jgi:hypothetical protein
VAPKAGGHGHTAARAEKEPDEVVVEQNGKKEGIE